MGQKKKVLSSRAFGVFVYMYMTVSGSAIMSIKIKARPLPFLFENNASSVCVSHDARCVRRMTRHIAYLLVHSFASWLYLVLSVLKILAISGTSGSSGLGSQRREQTERSSFEMVRAGDHCDFKTSRQMLPLLLMFGW